MAATLTTSGREMRCWNWQSRIRFEENRDTVQVLLEAKTVNTSSIPRHCRGFGQSACDLEAETLDASLRGEIQSAIVGIAARHVVRVFGTAQRAEVLDVRVENPETPGTADIHIAALVHFDAVDSVLARRARHVEKEFAFAKRAIGVNRVAEHNFPF